MALPGRTLVVVGNPTPGSRTLAAAVEVGERVARHLGLDQPPVSLDLATLGSSLLEWGAESVADAVSAVLQAEALVVGHGHRETAGPVCEAKVRAEPLRH